MGLLFEWDEGKARGNYRKHRVAFEEAASILGDPLSLTIEDPRFADQGETRFVTIGTSAKGRLLIVAHCDRGNRIRLISARKPTRGEKERI